MDRRKWLRGIGVGAGVAGLHWLTAGAARGRAPAADKLTPLKITDIQTILTAPARIRLVVVKVTTSEPGLYGLGCATFTQRARVVETAVQKDLRPALLGKHPPQLEAGWHASFVSSYWRSGAGRWAAGRGVGGASRAGGRGGGWPGCGGERPARR